jgi:hypothetical protein
MYLSSVHGLLLCLEWRMLLYCTVYEDAISPFTLTVATVPAPGARLSEPAGRGDMFSRCKSQSYVCDHVQTMLRGGIPLKAHHDLPFKLSPKQVIIGSVFITFLVTLYSLSELQSLLAAHGDHGKHTASLPGQQDSGAATAYSLHSVAAAGTSTWC